MTEIHGVTGAPYQTPNVRKKLPAAFTRARIDLDGGSRVKRSWKETPIIDVKAGDVIAGFGRVAIVQEFIDADSLHDHTGRPLWRIRLINLMDEKRDFGGEQFVLAFTPDVDVEP